MSLMQAKNQLKTVKMAPGVQGAEGKNRTSDLHQGANTVTRGTVESMVKPTS